MNTIKKFLSVISATALSGLCILNNMTIANAATGNEELGVPEAPIVGSEEYQGYINHYSNTPEIPSAGDVAFGSSCDLSQTKYFPSITNQSGKSCTLWSTTYYQFTYEANKLNNIASNANANIYSPVYPYSYLHSAFNYEAYDFLKLHGAVKVSEMPLNSSASTWCTNTNAMVNALNTRVSNDYANRVYTNHASENLDYIKSLLYGTNGRNGKVLSINTTDFYGWEYKTIKNPVTLNTEYAAVRSTKTSRNDAHAMTIVGFNDNIWCDLNGNNVKDNGEVGAFKVANSHGTSYKNSGYVWVMYDALNSSSMVSNWENTSKTRKPIFEHMKTNYNEFYWMDVENKDVYYVGQLTLNTNNCKSLKVYAGKNSTNTTPSNFDTLFNYNETQASSYNGTLVFDYASLADPIYSNLSGYRWFVQVAGTHISRAFTITDNLSKTIVNFNSISNGTHNRAINLSLGDVNYDGTINSLDLNILIEHNLGNIAFSNLQKYLGDFNNDGSITDEDVSALSRYLVFNRSISTNELKKINELNNVYQSYLIENNKSSKTVNEISTLNNVINTKIGVANVKTK